MSLSRRIFYNTLIQSVGKIIAISIGLVTLGLLTRFLREGGFGQYSTVLAFMGFAASLADFGLYLIVVRALAENKTDTSHEIISNVLGFRLVTAVAVLLGAALLALVLPYNPIVKQSMFVGILAFLFVPLNQALMGIFQKHLVTRIPTIAELAGRLVNLVLVYFFIQNSLSLPFFVWALTAGNAVIFFTNLILARKYEHFGIGFNLKIWKEILSASWPLAFSVVLSLGYFKGDTIILSLFHPADTVGVYSLPYKILEVLAAFPTMFVGLVMPLLAEHVATAWDKFHDILQRSFNAILLAVIPLVTVTLFFSREIIDLIKSREGFRDSAPLLQILILATALIFFGVLFGYSVVIVKKEKTMVYGYLLGFVAGLILYFSLIPRYSYWGAAWGTVITEIIVTTFAYFLVKKASGRGISLSILPKIIPGVTAMVLFFYYTSLPWLVEAGLGTAIYGLLIIVFGAVPAEFVRELMQRGSESASAPPGPPLD